MKMKSPLNLTTGASALALALTTVTTFAADQKAATWLDKTISPVANPIFFEDAKINSEVHPFYMFHWLPSTFDYAGGSVPLDGQVQVMAVQLRYAVNDRLAIIATKDGYIQFQPDQTLSRSYGWADLAAGLKYAVIDDRENALLVTPGFTITVPTGSTAVFQGDGSGEENIFVSVAKGFGNFHLLGNAGVRIPNNFAEQTAQLHYSLQADYFVHQYFIPFAVLNGFTCLSNGKDRLLGSVPLNTEMYDLINFGSTDVSGRTMLTVGGGFRSRLLENLDVGVAYEAGVVDPVGIFDSRVTMDLVWRF